MIEFCKDCHKILLEWKGELDQTERLLLTEIVEDVFIALDEIDFHFVHIFVLEFSLMQQLSCHTFADDTSKPNKEVDVGAHVFVLKVPESR